MCGPDLVFNFYTMCKHLFYKQLHICYTVNIYYTTFDSLLKST